MVELLVKFKPYTNSSWAFEKIFKVRCSEDFQIERLIKQGNNLSAVVLVPEDEELYYSRAIRMISPQVISVSRVR